jgi:hypothetical protein
MYKLIVAGARTVNQYSGVTSAVDPVIEQLDKLLISPDDIEIVSGHAHGVDKYGERYAQDNQLDLVIMPANWNKYGNSAGPIRNKKMAEYADGLVAVRHNNSRGTANMIKCAEEEGLEIWIFEFRG